MTTITEDKIIDQCEAFGGVAEECALIARRLDAENDRLQARVEALEAENEQLEAENEQLEMDIREEREGRADSLHL